MNFRKMRRCNQELSREESTAILNRCTSGTLALCGDDDYPYSVPVSYAYEDNKLFFHSAREGHKIDAIKANNKVSFSVIDKDEVVAEKFTTFFRSVVVFGKAYFLEHDDEKIDALKKISAKYSPEFEAESLKEAKDALDKVCIVKIEIDHMSGKQAKELVK